MALALLNATPLTLVVPIAAVKRDAHPGSDAAPMGAVPVMP
jgi:hypothetical protein